MLLTNVRVKSFKADLVKGEVVLAFTMALDQQTLGERFQLTQWQEDEVDLSLEVHPEGGVQMPLFDAVVAVGQQWEPAVVHDADAPQIEVAPEGAEPPAAAPEGETLDEFIGNLDMDGDEDS